MFQAALHVDSCITLLTCHYITRRLENCPFLMTFTAILTTGCYLYLCHLSMITKSVLWPSVLIVFDFSRWPRIIWLKMKVESTDVFRKFAVLRMHPPSYRIICASFLYWSREILTRVFCYSKGYGIWNIYSMMPFWAKKNPVRDPCQKQACAIQACLQAKNYDESACRKFTEALERCCERHVGRESVVCSGIKTSGDKPDKWPGWWRHRRQSKPNGYSRLHVLLLKDMEIRDLPHAWLVFV